MNEEKRQLLNKRLEQELFNYDPEFKALMLELLSSDRQLDNVERMLTEYKFSELGKTNIAAIELVKQLQGWDTTGYYFLTLTFNPNSWNWEWEHKELGKSLDRKSAEAKHKVRIFHENLSKTILGKKSFRKGMRLRHISVSVGGNSTVELHYHSIIESPPDQPAESFDYLVKQLWNGNVNCKPVDDNLFNICHYLISNKNQANELGDNLLIEKHITHKQAA